MSTYYEAVGEEPTYELAEIIIKAIIYELKEDIDHYNIFPSTSGYTEYPLEKLRSVYEYRFNTNKRKDTAEAVHLIIKHFPDILKISEKNVYVKHDSKHLLHASDLLIMDYYITLLTQYEESVSKYQRYLKKQQDRQEDKLLFVLLLPFILVILAMLVGD